MKGYLHLPLSGLLSGGIYLGGKGAFSGFNDTVSRKVE